MEQTNTELKIMTYNVQWFTGINGQLDMQKKIIDKYNPHIIGIQELSTNGKINRIGKSVLSGYKNRYLSEHKNFTAIVSKYALSNVKSIDFKNQDPEDMKRYGETRAYTRARLSIDGKLITFINTHLCYLTPEIKYKQMQELFNIANKHRYAIITGDFNCFMKHIGDEEYIGLYKRFIDAGYHLADCEKGITKTWTDKKMPKYLSNFDYPTDNIITSGNISIKKVVFDKTKLSYLDGNMVDHVPIVAKLCIY